jgi:hypothetical protein
VSVENRIFWLLVGILSLYLVLSATGRGAVKRFTYAIFGYSTGDQPTAPAPSSGSVTPPSDGGIGGPTISVPPPKLGTGIPGAVN